MFDETLVAVVREACGHPVEEPGGAVRLLSSSAPAFDVMDPSVERGGHLPALAPLKSEGSGLMRYINLTPPGGRCSLMGVRNPG